MIVLIMLLTWRLAVVRQPTQRQLAMQADLIVVLKGTSEMRSL